MSGFDQRGQKVGKQTNISGDQYNVGGDIHRTRVLRYDATETVGYPLTELVTSPIHASVIDAANAPHPDLVHDSGEPHSFLLLTVDTTVTPPTLRAQFQNAAGWELYTLTLDTAMLLPD